MSELLPVFQPSSEMKTEIVKSGKWPPFRALHQYEVTFDPRSFVLQLSALMPGFVISLESRI